MSKYKPITDQLAKNFPYPVLFRGDDSDIDIRQKDGDSYYYPYFCLDCPVKTTEAMNAKQLSDHINLIHLPRGDKVPPAYVEHFGRLASRYAKWKAAEKKDKEARAS